MLLKEIIDKEIKNQNNIILTELLTEQLNKIDELQIKYNKYLNMYPTLNDDLNKYYKYKEEKEIIDLVFDVRKLMTVDFDLYYKKIEDIKNIINERFPDDKILNKITNNTKLLFKIKKNKFYKSDYSYKKINLDIIDNMEKELINIYMNIMMIYKKFNLDTSIIEKNNSIYILVNKFEKNIYAINSKIDLINYANMNISESDKLKFKVLHAKNNLEESNLLKKVNFELETSMNKRDKRRAFRKQNIINARNNMKK